MKNIALGIVIVWLLFELFCGFIYGTPFNWQVCDCLLLFAFICYTEKHSYINILLSGAFVGSCYELIDESAKLNDGGVLPSDKLFTALWVTITVFRVGYKITKKWR